MIQGSINQLLNLTALVAKLDPGSERRAEIYKGKQEVEAAGKRADIVQQETGHLEGGPKGSVGHELMTEALEEYQSGIERQFKANPTTRGFHDTMAVRNELAARRKQAETEAQQTLEEKQAELMRSKLLEGTPEGQRQKRDLFWQKAQEEARRKAEEDPEMGAPGGR